MLRRIFFSKHEKLAFFKEMKAPRFPYAIFLFSAFAAAAAGIQAEAVAQEAPNLLQNSSFETVKAVPNLMYATTGEGFIETGVGSAPVLKKEGGIGAVPMPASVSLGDANGDGLLDLLVSSPKGQMNLFYNSGTAEEPVFTSGSLLPLSLAGMRPSDDEAMKEMDEEERENYGVKYQAFRVHLQAQGEGGGPEIWIGNYAGEILRVPSVLGQGGEPQFSQPKQVSDLVVPTSKVAGRRWGNVFAPVLWDFDADGKLDLIIGEGSYSANSVHIFLNEGTAAAPKFSDAGRHVLAYGEGREQLTPAVADYDGDGAADLLVADSTGNIGFYGGARESWKPGDTLPFANYISPGMPPVAGAEGQAKEEIFTVAAGDLTGDGNFDLVTGTASGKVYFLKNIGKAGQPAFDVPRPIKAKASAPFLVPSFWRTKTDSLQPALFPYANVVTGETEPGISPPNGSKVLKLGYLLPFAGAAAKPQNALKNTGTNPFEAGAPPQLFGVAPAAESSVEVGATYQLSFRVRGRNAPKAYGMATVARTVRLGEDRVERGARGSAKVKENTESEALEESWNFSVGGTWAEVRKEFTVRFNSAALNKPGSDGKAAKAVCKFFLAFELAPGTGEVFLDDFKLIKK